MMLKIDDVVLKKGAHSSRDTGMCAMEAVAWLAGEPHSDAPQCACPVITRCVQVLNDKMSEDDRNTLLKPLLPRVIGTRGSMDVMVRRAMLCADRAVRVFAPMALDAAGLKAEAERLRALPEVVDEPSAGAARAARAADQAAAGAAEAARAAWAADWAGGAADQAADQADQADQAADQAAWAAAIKLLVDMIEIA